MSFRSFARIIALMKQSPLDSLYDFLRIFAKEKIKIKYSNKLFIIVAIYRSYLHFSNSNNE